MGAQVTDEKHRFDDARRHEGLVLVPPVQIAMTVDDGERSDAVSLREPGLGASDRLGQREGGQLRRL
jgi:hypothetical protein